MAISFSRPDPASPSAVGSASFTSSRRGFDQDEVRDFLRMVAAELARLQERERFLEGELRELQTRGLSAPGRLDEETVTTILGEETARVLAAARDAAVDIRERAEDSATRLVKEAVEDAARIRDTAREEAMRIRDDANGDIEAEIELAKQQGRDLVVEAREYREKMLAELTRRRDAAKAQIDKLVHERDRLVGAFQRAKMSADEALAFLRSAHDDDEEYIFDFSRPPESRDATTPPKSTGTTTGTTTTSSPSASAHPSASTGATAGSAIFDYTADIERAASETKDDSNDGRTSTEVGRSERPTVAPRGMPELPKRPAFLGPAEETSRQDAFGPIDLHPTDVEVVDEEEPLEQEDTAEGIVTSIREMEDEDVDLTDVVGTDVAGMEVVGTEVDDTNEPEGHLAQVVSLFGERRRQPSGSINDARSQHPVTAGPLDDRAPTTPVEVAPSEPETEIETAPEPPSVETADQLAPVETAPTSDVTPSRVDEIFARLRAGSTAVVTKAAREVASAGTVKAATAKTGTTKAATARAGTAKTGTAKVGTTDARKVDVTAAPFSPRRDPKRLTKRATVLAPIIAEMDTHLKRALVDDLNVVLERLSHKRTALTTDAALGSRADHLERVASALSDDFRAAATEGAKSMKSAGGSVRRIKASELREALDRTIASVVIDHLRTAVDTAIASADGDRTRVTDAARVAYRDARSRSGEVAADLGHEAHAAGAFMSLETGTPVCWIVDPDGPECADGEDNSLAGGVGCGGEFPTGDKRPLAHAGCRCLLGPAQH